MARSASPARNAWAYALRAASAASPAASSFDSTPERAAILRSVPEWLARMWWSELGAERARSLGVGLHELHRHCEVHAPSPPALLLGFALPTESELTAAASLLAEAIC